MSQETSAMSRARLAVATLAATVTVLAMAAPASAHEEIVPGTVRTGTPTFLTLGAANEMASDLTRITLEAPPGLALGTATREPVGWTANRTDAAVTWSGGAVKPQHFEQWGFEIEGANQPGLLTWHVTLAFADGSTTKADVVITAEASGVTAPTTVAGVTTPTTVAGAPAPAPAPATTEAPVASIPSSGGSGNGVATGALALAGVALLAAVAALAVALDGRKAGTATTGDDQDW